jgi:hypothetical protein
MTEHLEDQKLIEAKRRLAEATAVYNRHRYKCDTGVQQTPIQVRHGVQGASQVLYERAIQEEDQGL